MRSILICVIAAALCSCYAAPKPETFEKSRISSRSFDDVWRAAIAVVTEEEWPIQVIEKESGIITTDFVIMGGNVHEDIDCGKSMYGTEIRLIADRVRCKLSIHITRVGESTQLRLNTHIEAYYEGWQNCNSTGAIEAQIFEMIDAELVE